MCVNTYRQHDIVLCRVALSLFTFNDNPFDPWDINKKAAALTKSGRGPLWLCAVDSTQPRVLWRSRERGYRPIRGRSVTRAHLSGAAGRRPRARPLSADWPRVLGQHLTKNYTLITAFSTGCLSVAALAWYSIWPGRWNNGKHVSSRRTSHSPYLLLGSLDPSHHLPSIWPNPFKQHVWQTHIYSFEQSWRRLPDMVNRNSSKVVRTYTVHNFSSEKEWRSWQNPWRVCGECGLLRRQ